MKYCKKIHGHKVKGSITVNKTNGLAQPGVVGNPLRLNHTGPQLSPCRRDTTSHNMQAPHPPSSLILFSPRACMKDSSVMCEHNRVLLTSLVPSRAMFIVSQVQGGRLDSSN